MPKITSKRLVRGMSGKLTVKSGEGHVYKKLYPIANSAFSADKLTLTEKTYNEFVEKMMEETGAQSISGLSRMLGYNPNTIRNAGQYLHVPESILVKMLMKFNINPHWLLGESNMRYVHPSPYPWNDEEKQAIVTACKQFADKNPDIIDDIFKKTKAAHLSQYVLQVMFSQEVQDALAPSAQSALVRAEPEHLESLAAACLCP